ncbi:hypothetical protein G4B88_025069 [Cannabis sativa]|uniref:SOSEKI DIX-like domain-containing protein n=1 Tax=Cannabis sativa TaxID=3483 RepID=A0A7J6FBR4_CANSA|nr:hypothetical protein G4B88_025069 [Cannabis sativa]
MRTEKAMEGQQGKCGEIRRLHIIYFLTHLGRSEHPHLIRVHHLTRTGVYLRDIKRWLGDLRGKDMAEAYAWSYKRRYKSGYVWQDLVDEDLITPLSDNEYVLKGSEIISTPVDGEKTDIINASSYHYCTENKAVKTTIMRVEDDVKAAHKQISSCKNSCSDPKISPQPTATTTKTFSEINEDSSLSSFCSEKSSLTDELDSVKQENDNYQSSICNIKQDHNQEEHSTTTKKLEISTPLFNNNKVKKRSKTNNELDDSMRAAGSSSFSSPSSSSQSVPLSAKRKSFSGGASNVLKSFITCRAVDTNDTVLVTVKHHGASGGFQKSTGSVKANPKPNNNNNNEKDDQYVFTGGRRSFHTCWKYQEFEVQQPQNYNARRSCDERSSTTTSSSKKDQQSEFSKQRTIPSAYRPAREPNCSQCGKAFKPEKLHSHMKSCRGMKTLGNKSNANTSVNKSTVLYSHQGSSATSSYKESALAHFLTSSS